MTKFLIRYNTESVDGKLRWRLLEGKKQTLCDEIRILVPCFTTTDEVSPGIFKSHITAIAHEKVEKYIDGKLLITIK